ncbi:MULTISPECIES: ATP-binding protein [unclassified Janthinobacterium]|uniref:ATP-binding protein n=1 Tax=unclassified Janthinobacterium TaxID=2610881 RepID=UPI0016230C19|nr:MULTISPECIES: ATP-binding protein [unclassified Janthinobacterium]MBB5607810.1 hypothetical protein [Janthinobacterium sp. S3T4]MBB5613041.1 hypothetical protein [Janthinobacterium sp. S3M3]
MDNIAGSPVEGANFFGRDKEAARLADILVNDDILLLGPRRIGKTSIARAVMAQLRTQGWSAIEINVASCIDERGFLDKLDAALAPELATISEKARNLIGNALSAVGSRIKSIKLPIPGTGGIGVDIKDGIAEEWAAVACDVLRLIGQAENNWLIYVDELPIMLFNIMRNDPATGVQRVRRFLDWLRNDVRGLPGAHAVRWLISGSVGLDTLVQQHGMADTINSLSHQSLPAFKDEVAIAMLKELAAHYVIPLTPDDARSLVEAVQWPQPYYLQVAFHHLRTLVSSHADEDMRALIAQAVDIMVQPGSDNDFYHWEQRLHQQLLQTDASHAMALLNLCSQDRQGARPEALLAVIEDRLPHALPEVTRRIFINLHDILERDAYWWPDDSSGVKRYRFRLEPLRRWWLRRNTL